MKKLDDELKAKLAKQINDLKSTTSSKIGKYTRNLQVYTNSRGASLQSIEVPTILGYYENATIGSGFYNSSQDTMPSMNVVKSIIDTIVSKVSNSKPRPFINTVNGSFKDMIVVTQAQQFFDNYFDTEKVHDKITKALQNACIFDSGYIYIDEETGHIVSALPNQIYFNAAETTYGINKQVYYTRQSFPVTLLPKEYKQFAKRENYCNYGIYYNIEDKVKIYVIDAKIVDVKDFDKPCLPVIPIYYTPPIIGESNMSICDILNGVQLEINQLMAKISEASKLTPANTILVPDDSNIKVGQLNNKIGQCIQYHVSPNGSAPVTVATPTFIAPAYWELVENLVQKAYNLVGISQLDAQSLKPKGLSSGVALSTLEDITSDRFDVLLQQYIHTFTNVAKTVVQLFDGNENILPKTPFATSVKWRDICSLGDKMIIQYTAADILSKDPSEKIKQIDWLNQKGIIPNSRIAALMEIPDLEQGYNMANNALNAVMFIIQDCVENDNYSIPDFIPIQMLKTEILNTLLKLKQNNNKENNEAITKLYKLYQNCVSKDNTLLGPDEIMVDENNQPVSSEEIAQNAYNEGANEAAMQQEAQAYEAQPEVQTPSAEPQVVNPGE